jgi:hypothetical protein
MYVYIEFVDIEYNIYVFIEQQGMVCESNSLGSFCEFDRLSITRRSIARENVKQYLHLTAFEVAFGYVLD